MKQQVRELLVTAKVAQNWHSHFDEKVEELMAIVNKIDTDTRVLAAGELLDVYHKTKVKTNKTHKRKLAERADKPFEFFVFRN